MKPRPTYAVVLVIWILTKACFIYPVRDKMGLLYPYGHRYPYGHKQNVPVPDYNEVL